VAPPHALAVQQLADAALPLVLVVVLAVVDLSQPTLRGGFDDESDDDLEKRPTPRPRVVLS